MEDISLIDTDVFIAFFFWIRGNLIPRKAHFVRSGERVKPRLSQALTRDARLDLNSKPAMQILNSLSSRHALEDLCAHNECTDTIIKVSNVTLIYESFFLFLIFMQLLITLVMVKRNSV